MACITCVMSNGLRHANRLYISKRFLSGKKRFYKSATVTGSNGQFEVNLDMKKLKTPMGKIFTVPSEPLAFAVAAEWNNQDKTIALQNMHLTGLCNSALDNPTGKSCESTVDSILSYLESDTVCFRTDEPEELSQLQTKEWDPIINVFQERYNVNLVCSREILATPILNAEAKSIMRRHLLSYNFWALIGLQFAADAIKSLVLTLATIDHHLTAERAVSLSRLEVEYQIAKWGNVEWAHDFDLLDLRSRFSAATLFVGFNSTWSTLKTKRTNVNFN